MIEKELNDILFRDIETCRCGAHNGAYARKDDEGYWFVCNDCDLPIKNSYHLNESMSAHRRDGEYDD